MTVQVFFEFLPVGLAVIAAFMMSCHYQTFRRFQDKLVCLVSVFACGLLIIAQTSWYVSAVIEQDLSGTFFANTIWTLFNSLVMISYIVGSINRKK